ncbi:hypothetical protein V1514DRAFT_333481 [Lipomyces japonicus]|uniref:uncharacterized protein n=1 Tax=Lipomyces japonicus TaxID=56871 RepID=UPI0034CFBA44
MALSSAQQSIHALVPLVNSASAAVDIVTRATTAPDVFSFGFLFLHPALTHHLRSTADSARHHELLRIFAAGTWQDYVDLIGRDDDDDDDHEDQLPRLTDAQEKKLKQLTLVTLAGKSHALAYDELLAALHLPDLTALAGLVVSCVYANLLTATLDTRHQVVRVTRVNAGRDVVDNQAVSRLQQVITTWAGACASTIDDLNSQVRIVREKVVRQASDVREYNRQVEAINKQILAPVVKAKAKDKTEAKEDGLRNNDLMEVDEGPVSESSFRKKRKQRTVS